jgi:hypothetical protein
VGSAYSGLVSSVYFSKHSRVGMGSAYSEVDFVQLIILWYEKCILSFAYTQGKGGGGQRCEVERVCP